MPDLPQLPGRGSHESHSYRLTADESVPAGVARIARGRIDHALDELLGRTDSTPEQAVHEARKDLKKLRALVRLVRAGIGGGAYRRENAGFRDIGRGLSGVRDADVMIATLSGLEQRYGDDLPPDAAGGLRQALEAHRRSLAAGERQSGTGEAVRELADARVRVDGWAPEADDFAPLRAGLERNYRRGRAAWRVAREDPSTAALHEWRKRVKDLWYHLRLLSEVWPPVREPLADAAHELGDLLGDDHDLAVVLEWAHAHASALDGMDRVVAFEAVVGRRRAELQVEALAIAARIYADRPKAFGRQIERWWEAWREESASS